MPARLTMRHPLSICLFAVTVLGCWQTTDYRPEWKVLTDCRYVDDPDNEADVVRIAHHDGTNVFRLYFVDAVEIRKTPLLNTQAGVFGTHFTNMYAWGQEITARTKRHLEGRRLTVITGWHEVHPNEHPSRYYAFIKVDGHDLGEWLLTQGYARVCGMLIAPPSGLSAEEERNRLFWLQRGAWEANRGAWGGMEE